MAVSLHDKNQLLQNSVIRLGDTPFNYITAEYSADSFNVINGTPSTPSITITPVLHGALYGVPTFQIISGISSIDTTTAPGSAILNYASLTANIAIVRISLTFLGTTYTKDCSVEGQTVAPGQPATVTVTPSGTGLSVYWDSSSESDVVGYEIRTTNSGWGTAGFTYRGAATDTDLVLTSTSIGAVNTWYLRAYDSSGLYSTSSRIISYTVTAPTTVSGVAYSFTTTSASSSLCKISWTPVLPTFGFKYYKVYIGSDTYLVSNPFIDIESTWVGNINVEVTVFDLLGNESAKSTAITASKSRPNAPTTITFTPYGEVLRMYWTAPAKTSLPIYGYEIRKNNTGWGTKDSNLVWQGTATEYQVTTDIILGTNSYYINTIDTDGKYATSGTLISYTVVKPNPPVSIITTTNSVASNYMTLVTSWSPDVVTSFKVANYKISIVKPDGRILTATADSTTFITDVDWLGTAYVRISSIDLKGNESTNYSETSYTVLAPNAVSSTTESVIENGVLISWNPPTKTTLPILGYEIRTSDANWGINGTFPYWRGVSTSLEFKQLSLGTNTYYIKAYDIEGVYSSTATAINIDITAPNVVTGVSHIYSSTTTGTNVELSWTAPTAGKFPIAYYKVDVTVNSITSTYKVLSTKLTLEASWSTNASINIYSVDTFGSSSTAVPYTVNKVATGTVGVVTVTYSTSSIELDWPDLAKTGLPIAGYEIRSSDAGWGTSGFVWKGSLSKATLTKYLTTGSSTLYIKGYDTSGYYSTTARSISITVNAPSVPVVGTVEFSSSTITSATVTIPWTSTAGTYGLYGYDLEITKNSVTTSVTLNSTTWTTLADWTGNASVRLRSIDALGIKSAWSTAATITKSAPAQPAIPTVVYNPNSVDIDWADNTKTTLPVVGYEIRDTDLNWGTPGARWKGSVSSTSLNKYVSTGTTTLYLKAYDSSGTYSTLSRSISLSITPPGTPTLTEYSFADTASTAATVTFLWTAVAGTYPISYYSVEFVRNGISEFVSLNSTTWTTLADWDGSSTLKVTAVDTQGINSGLLSTAIIKNKPGTVTAPTTTVSDTKISATWSPITKTSLPILGYEIRSTSTGFGNSGQLYRGSDTKALLSTIALGLNTYYIAAYDTDGRYGDPTTFTYNRLAPNPPTNVTETIADTLTTAATISFNWTPPASITFDIKEYDIVLTKPGGLATVYATVSANTWSTLLDWNGTATIQVYSRDVLGSISSTAGSKNITKTAPSAPTNYLMTPQVGNALLSWSGATKGTLGIAGYEVRARGTTPGGSDYYWKGTSNNCLITNLVEGTNQLDIWTYDTDGKYSVSAYQVNYTVAKPSTPTANSPTFSTTLTSANVMFSWASSTDPFGITQYEVSFTTTDPALVTTNITNSTAWELPAYWNGTGTLAVKSKNSIGVYSTVSSVNITKSRPSQPGAFAPITVSGTSLVLDWPDNNVTSLPILGYEVRTADVVDNLWGTSGYLWKGSSSRLLVDIKGSAIGTSLTYYIRAYDTDNRYSTISRASTTYVVAAPANPSNLVYKFEDTALTSAIINLSWDSATPVFGLQQYQVTGTFTLVNGISTSAGSALVNCISTKGLHIGDIISNCSSIPNGTTITSINSNGTQFTLSSGASVITASNVSCSFNDITYINSTKITKQADWIGSKTFIVKTVDNLDNLSTGISVSAEKLLPGSATNFRAQVIDNTVLLYWDLPAITTLPISHVLIKKGTNWASATKIGEKDGTFTTITELQAGTYTYWISVVDTDNNYSTPISYTTQVSQPPDYIFNTEWTSNFSGTKTNAIIENGALVLPVNTTETFAAHFTTPGWAGPSAQVSAGYPVYIQPGTTTGTYQEVFDYGTTLGASQISTSINGTVIAGTPNVSMTIETGVTAGVYTNTFNSGNAFLTNFRYVRLTITVTQAVAGSIYKINGLTLRLDAKQKTDSGTSVLTLGGAHVQGSIALDYLTWQVGSYPSGFSLNGTTAENSIVLSNGPSGLPETMWACLDTDIANDAEGGWNSSYFSADLSKSHLFACFVKTTTNNGGTYFGTSQDNTIATLAGVTTNNPYFVSGIDLPALNTWYLMIGYVYPVGYGTTDHGISGIYDLSGTKVLSGTSFKAVSGSTIMHRAYHYYNTTATGSIVQYMTRPVVLEADYTNAVSNANTLISYILQCAKEYGVSVVPNANFIDVVAINATPQGAQSTPVVDFYDKPYPTRFNIFNYNTSGALVQGTVSWSVRGY